MGGMRETQYVPTLTLDSLLGDLPAPDFVKIDIEGAEIMALSGATHMIQDVRPVFYIEVSEAHSAEALRIFHSANYIASSPAGDLLTGECTPNTFFVPKENQKALDILSIKAV